MRHDPRDSRSPLRDRRESLRPIARAWLRRLAFAALDQKFHAGQARESYSARPAPTHRSGSLPAAGDESGSPAARFQRHCRRAKSRSARARCEYPRKICGGKRGLHQQRRGDRALGDRDDRMRAPPAIAGIALRIKGQADAVAISQRLSGQHRDLFGRAHSAALQRFAQNGLLDTQVAPRNLHADNGSRRTRQSAGRRARCAAGAATRISSTSAVA